MINVRDCDVFSVIVCPSCGGIEIEKSCNVKAASCRNCHMFFRVSYTDRSNLKIVYASPRRGFTFRNYYWRAAFITNSLPPTWRRNGVVMDDHNKRMISKRMAERWEAHQVAIALKGGRAA